MPCSAKVGTSGIPAARSVDATPSARSCPLCTADRAGGNAVKAIGVCPPTVAWIIRHPGVEARVHDEAGTDRHDRVAVRGHACDLAGRNVATGAADVLDVELLAEIVGELLGHDAGDGIGRSAGRKADHDAHRL